MPLWVRPQTLYLSACPAAGRQGWAGLGGGCLGPGLPDPGGVQRQPAGAHRRPAQHRWGPCCRCRRWCWPWVLLVWRGSVAEPWSGSGAQHGLPSAALIFACLPACPASPCPPVRPPACLPWLQTTSPRTSCSTTSACWPPSPRAASTPSSCSRRGCCATAWQRPPASWTTWPSRTAQKRQEQNGGTRADQRQSSGSTVMEQRQHSGCPQALA